MIYEIWSEGYAASGDRGTAIFFGKEEGATFQEACDKFFAEYKKEESIKNYDPKRLTYWACRLYDNETDARKSFG